jgi:hypothetical protein
MFRLKTEELSCDRFSYSSFLLTVCIAKRSIQYLIVLLLLLNSFYMMEEREATYKDNLICFLLLRSHQQLIRCYKTKCVFLLLHVRPNRMQTVENRRWRDAAAVIESVPDS